MGHDDDSAFEPKAEVNGLVRDRGIFPGYGEEILAGPAAPTIPVVQLCCQVATIAAGVGVTVKVSPSAPGAGEVAPVDGHWPVAHGGAAFSGGASGG